MLKSLVPALLLVNAVLLAALIGAFGQTTASDEREPERLKRQHQPEVVRILSPEAASAALAAASALAAAASSP